MTPQRDDGVTTACPACGQRFTPTGRQRFCSHACRQAAYRRRQPTSATPPLPTPPSRPRRDITVYQCPDCEQRYHAQQWCEDCNRPCRRIGVGGTCPHCDEPITVDDLLDQHKP